MASKYINPGLPAMIRGLYKAELRPRSIQEMLDLAADLVQELIDFKQATPDHSELIERAKEYAKYRAWNEDKEMIEELIDALEGTRR